jgi:hypothetical protein
VEDTVSSTMVRRQHILHRKGRAPVSAREEGSLTAQCSRRSSPGGVRSTPSGKRTQAPLWKGGVPASGKERRVSNSWKSGASAPRKNQRNGFGLQPGGCNGSQDDYFYVFRRNADCAKPLASALFSRGTCEMENASDRANFRQVQCRE